MNSLNKRLQKIEEIQNPKELPTAWIATIDVDGSAVLTHNSIDDISFDNREDLEKYVDEQDIDRRFLLVVEYVNSMEKK